jgi:hypothetical protein
LETLLEGAFFAFTWFVYLHSFIWIDGLTVFGLFAAINRR